jgi:Calx-beta domain
MHKSKSIIVARSRIALTAVMFVAVAIAFQLAIWSSKPVIAQSGSASSVPLIISEFRLSGPNGLTDEFVEIYNNSDSSHTVNSVDGTSTGYALVGSSNATVNDSLVTTRFVISNGTIIPPRAHMLFTHVSGYTLSNYPAGNGTTAVGNLTYIIPIPENSGIALFGTSIVGNYNLANRIDAVGSNADNNTLFREGTGYPALSTPNLEGSFFRKLPGGCTGSISGNCNTISLITTTLGPSSPYPQDTNDNAADILYGDVAATNLSVSRRLSAPGPENLSGPITGIQDPGLVIARLDSTVADDAAPNRVRNPTPGSLQNSTFGTVSFRRRITNNVGQPITRLRFRISDITTLPSIGSGCNVEPAPAICAADLRALSSNTSTVSINDPVICAPSSTPCNVNVQGTTLETPPDQAFGGGFNSSWSVGNITLATPLGNGASINVQFVTGLQQTGVDRLYVVVEALPRSGPASTAVVRLAGPQPPSTFQLEQSVYSVAEDVTSMSVTVLRSGNNNSAATVDFATADDTATQKQDYTIARGTLKFAPGEISKTFNVLINEDSKVEGTESFSLGLSNPTNGVIGTVPTATVQITDDAGEPTTNVIDDAGIFVGQHYHDFLNRQADADGLAFWTSTITSCDTDAQCVEVKRINASAAFFLSIEFQQTSFFVIRMQRVAFGRRSDTAASRFPYLEFVRDAQRVGDGVIVGEPGAEQQLEINKQSYAMDVATSTAFISRFPTSLSGAAFVDALFASAVVTPTAEERTAAINAFGSGGTTGRVAALRSVVDSSSVVDAELNAAFVLLQYYGYLRRNPTDAPDSNDDGYQFWLTKLNLFDGDFIAAEMVKAFIESDEYRGRFGPVSP